MPCGRTYIYPPRYQNAPKSNKSTSITNWKRVNSLSSEKWRRLQVPLRLKLSERPVITLISNTSIELLFPWFMFTVKIKCIFRTWAGCDAGCDAPNWGEICGTNLRKRFNIVPNSKEYSISTVAAQSKNYELVCEKLIRRSMHRCGGDRTVGWLVNDVANRCDFFK